ncbi:MAG: patatin family protein [Lachnospiraceae bacterium]|nr:patatin family protein [Lachnospiraceae bacterium]
MKTGILFEGGASRTIFSCGVMDRLLDADIMPDYVLGVSAGITYATSYISKQKGRNLEMLTKYSNDSRYMGFRNLINPKNKAYYGLKFAYEQIPNELLPFDEATYSAFKGEAKAAVTNIETGEVEFLNVMPKETRTKSLIATCALPLLFPIVKIDGKLYMDGGIADSVPYKQAFKDGCDRLMIVLTREAGYRKEFEKTLKLACVRYRKYPKFCDAMMTRAERYNQTMEEIEALEQKGDILVFRPTVSKGFSRLEKDVAKIGTMYADGYEQTSKRINEIEKFFRQ